jgi:hypothetical protein
MRDLLKLKKDLGQVPCISLLATSIPLHLPRRLPQINGDTRRRKRRLREKLEKLDAIRYAPAIRAATAEMKRRVMDKIERELFANAPRQTAERSGASLDAVVRPS